MKLIIFIIILIINSVLVECIDNIVYVDNKSRCVENCGGVYQPHENLYDAIEHIKELYGTQKSNNNIIYVEPGNYKGLKNIGLNIPNIPIKILSKVTHFIDTITLLDKYIGVLSNMAILDCEKRGRGFIVDGSNTMFKLKGFIIRQCVGGNGGGMSVVNGAVVTMSNILFEENTAGNGGGLYLEGSSTAYVSQTAFIGNTAIDPTGGSVFAVNSSSIYLTEAHSLCVSPTLPPNTVYVSSSLLSVMAADSSTSVFQNTNIRCTQPSQCTLPSQIACAMAQNQNTFRYVVIPEMDPPTFSPPSTCVVDGICDSKKEDCFTCDKDCACAYPSAYLLYPYVESLTHSKILSTPEVRLGDTTGSIPNGRMEFYASTKHRKYQLKIEVEGCSLNMFIDRKSVFSIPEGPLQTYYPTIHFSNLTSPSFFNIVFKCNIENPSKSFSIKWRHNNKNSYKFIDGFYNINVCGDGIYDTNEIGVGGKFSCSIDETSSIGQGKHDIPPRCGDGTCNEEPNDCPIDCYGMLSQTCRELAPPATLDPEYLKDDFVGSVVNNQYLYSLPGIDVFSHGVDILTGEAKETRIFHFGYCDDTTYSTIHDLYRGLVYTIPYGLSGVPAPKCTYASQSTSYRSSSQMASEMAVQSGLEASVSANGGFWGIDIGISLAFSQEQSVTMASELEQTGEGTFVVSEVQCATTKVSLAPSDLKLHPNFLRDLVQASNLLEMAQVIKRYGTFYYNSATLGGTLKLVSMVSSAFASKSSEQEVSQNAAVALAAHVSAPIGSVSGSVDVSSDSAVTQAAHDEFTSSSQHTTVITRGGAPGAFSPDEFGKNTFADWAREVDLRPVPINSHLKHISDLIPKNWRVYDPLSQQLSTQTIYELWVQSQYIYLLDQYTKHRTPIENIKPNDSMYVLLRLSNGDSETFKIQTGIQSSDITSVTIDNKLTTTLFWAPKYNDMKPVASNTNPDDTPPPYDFIDIVSARYWSVRRDVLAQHVHSVTVRIQDLRIYNLNGETFRFDIVVYGTLGNGRISKLYTSDYYTFSFEQDIAFSDFQGIGDPTHVKFALSGQPRSTTKAKATLSNVNIIYHCPPIMSHSPTARINSRCSDGQSYIYPTPDKSSVQLFYATKQKAFAYRNVSPTLSYDTSLVVFPSDSNIIS